MKNLPNDLMKANIDYMLGRSYEPIDENNLLKGEGSRGGKIVGHTKSGKAIYRHQFHHMKSDGDSMSDYEHTVQKENYTTADHQDAMEHHLKDFDKKKAKYDKGEIGVRQGRGSAQNSFAVAQYHSRQKGVKTDRDDVKNKTYLDAI